MLYNCTLGKRVVVRPNAFVEGCALPDGFHIFTTDIYVYVDSDLSGIPQVGFREEDEEDVAQTNINLVVSYKKL